MKNAYLTYFKFQNANCMVVGYLGGSSKVFIKATEKILLAARGRVMTLKGEKIALGWYPASWSSSNMLEHQISSSLSRFSLSFLSPLLVYQLITTIQLELNKAKNENKTTNNEFSYQLFMQNLIQGLGPQAEVRCFFGSHIHG